MTSRPLRFTLRAMHTSYLSRSCIAALGLVVALAACSDDGPSTTDSDGATESSSGDGDGDSTTDDTEDTDDTNGDGDGDATTDPATDTDDTNDCEPGSFGCECDENGGCVDGLECDENNECGFPEEPPPEPKPLPTDFECTSTETVSFSNFTGNPMTQIIEADVTGPSPDDPADGAIFFLDFWSQGEVELDLAVQEQWDGEMCSHCVYMIHPDTNRAWWAAEGNLAITQWNGWEINIGNLSDLVLQETMLGMSQYQHTFIDSPTCYTAEPFDWNTIPEGGETETGGSETDGTETGGSETDGTETGTETGGVDPDLCVPTDLDSSCVACTKEACCFELEACAADEDCICALTCVQEGGDPMACQGQCMALNNQNLANALVCVEDQCDQCLQP